MSCKFYNAKTGEDIRMVNRRPDTSGLGNNVLVPMDWYYYAVKLRVGGNQVPKYYYKVYQSNNTTYTNDPTGPTGNERGGSTTMSARIKFYQYYNS